MSTQDMVTIEACIKLPAELAEELQEVVKATGKSQEDLICQYVTEGISTAMPQVKRKLFFSHTKKILQQHNISDEVVDEIVDKFLY
ncbi:MAG TPA: hypothetical protein ENK33_11880 [Desulfobacterales bacterium]|nr:hypothetical protein [Desulfobacterales bacterium]